MGLRDELGSQPKGGALCGVGVLLRSLDEQTAGELFELLNDPDVLSSSLGRLSQNRGWTVNGPAFARHRRKDCQCR